MIARPLPTEFFLALTTSTEPGDNARRRRFGERTETPGCGGCVVPSVGERFIANSDFLWLKDVAQILREEVPDQAAKVGTRTLPNFVARLGGLCNYEMKQLAASLDDKQLLSAAKAKQMLGWTPRTAREAVVATAHSLVDKGFV